LFVLHQLVSAGNAKDRMAERHRRAVIPDVVHAIGVRFVMNLFILILATAEMNGQVDAFSHPLSISSPLGRCHQDKVFGHQNSVAMQLSAPVIPVAREGGCIA
tara:strand:+ start:2045 stop:2353 length:309 start_codon:yes stop_codon:yes gene_type:complete